MATPQATKTATKNTFTNRLIFGYTRRQENELELSTNIPPLIYHFVAAFHHIDEYFDQAVKDCFTISDDKLTITNIKFCHWGHHTIYLNQWIPSKSKYSYRWKFRINKLKKKINFGLVCKQDPPNAAFWSWFDRPCYSFTNDQQAHKYRLTDYPLSKDYRKPTPETTKQNLKYGEGDEVTFILNMKTKTLNCKINDGQKFIVFDDINKDKKVKLKLVLSMENKGDSISLISFYEYGSKRKKK